MVSEFKLTTHEIECAVKFERKHRHSDINKGTIGGGIAYTFYPNAVSFAVEIKCLICGEKEDITDYDSW